MWHWFFDRLGLKGLEKICEVRKYINVTYMNTVSVAEGSVNYLGLLAFYQLENACKTANLGCFGVQCKLCSI